MGFTWVAADVSHFAAVDAWQPPDFAPRHRRPPRPARAVQAAAGLPRTLLTRTAQARPASAARAPGRVGLRAAP
jgi:hypothetical protein